MLVWDDDPVAASPRNTLHNLMGVRRGEWGKGCCILSF